MKKLGMLTLALTGLLAGGQSAHAVAQLRLSSGGDVFTISDGGLGDMNGTAGAVTFIGDVGSFEINVSTGLTKPTFGSATAPRMDLSSINSSTSAGTITIEFTETDFGPAMFSQLLSSVGGTTGGVVSFQTYGGVAPFERAVLLTDMGPFGTSPFMGTDSGSPAGLADAFSLTIVATITHGAGNRVSSFDNEVSTAVPEGGSTLMLLGSTLGMMGMFFRRRK